MKESKKQKQALLENLKETNPKEYKQYAVRLIRREQSTPNGNAYTLCKKLLGYEGTKELNIPKS